MTDSMTRRGAFGRLDAEAIAHLSRLGMGIAALPASHPIHRSVIEAQEAQRWLMVFTQGRLWTNQRRQECWERAKRIRAGTPTSTTIKSAIVQAVQEMERKWDSRRPIYLIDRSGRRVRLS